MAKKKIAKSKKKASATKKGKIRKSANKTIKSSKKKNARRKTKKALTTPKGYNNITPYLIVVNAARAIDFYKRIFGAKEIMRMSKRDGRIGHAELKIGDTKIMLADEHPEMNAHGPRAFGGTPVSIHLYVKNVDGTVEKAVEAGATVLRPTETMFFGDRSGTIEDPFGHKWHVSTHVEDVSKGEMKKRMTKLGI